LSRRDEDVMMQGQTIATYKIQVLLLRDKISNKVVQDLQFTPIEPEVGPDSFELVD
jgi:hypothetical protein